MAMLCWFYCIDFAWFLYYAFAPVLFIVSLFILKRGIRNARAGLRSAAFSLMFAAVIKICIFDVRTLGKEILCTVNQALSDVGCNTTGQKMLEFGGLLFLVFASFGLFLAHKKFMQIKAPSIKTPEEVNLRFWANVCLAATMGMVIWQCAPWVGSLTVGQTPAIFEKISWQSVAIINLSLILFGFWKAESCTWNYDVRKRKERGAHLNETWTARDTLWMTVFIYLVTLALSYVAHDVLKPKLPERVIQQMMQQPAAR